MRTYKTRTTIRETMGKRLKKLAALLPSTGMEKGISPFLETASIHTIDEFRQWTRDAIRPIFPHQSLAFGYGRIHGAGVNIDGVFAVDCPVEHLRKIRNSAGFIDSPILRLWVAAREPQFFEADRPWPDAPLEWLQQFRTNGLKNAAAHGVYDPERCLASYFSFHGLPCPLGGSQAETLKWLVPLMHETLLRVLDDRSRHGRFATLVEKLSAREKKILGYVRRGKTNQEISEAVFLSENTVKHHMATIFVKLGVANRSQLVARAAEHFSRMHPESEIDISY